MSPLLFRRLSDEQLGSRLASGEAAAFDELYRRYVHRLAAYGAHLLGDSALGDDVAQATLLKAYSAIRDGRPPDRMRPWLYRVAHNTALDLLARRRELPSAELPDRPARGAPETGALVAALAALPDRQRHVYVLRELHGLRIDETAAELGLVAAQVEQALFAARNRLAEHLVFGDRLDCVAVRRLSAGPLDRNERRALKTHVRSCGACRAELGRRGRALSGLPILSIDWLRGLAAGLAGGGAPAAAKVGAVVATAGIAAGVPGAVETQQRGVELLHPVPHVVSTHETRSAHTVARPRPTVARAATSAAAVPVVAHVETQRTGRDSSRRTSHRDAPAHNLRRDDGAEHAVQANDGGRGEHGDVAVAAVSVPVVTTGSSGPGGGDDAPAATVATATVPAVTTVVSADETRDGGHDGGGDTSGSSGGSSGGGGSDGGGGTDGGGSDGGGHGPG